MRKVLTALMLSAGLAVTVPAVAEAHPIDCQGSHWETWPHWVSTTAGGFDPYSSEYNCDDSYGWMRPQETWTRIVFTKVIRAHRCSRGRVWLDEWTISFKHPRAFRVSHDSHCV
jgi:hypothetical protein